MKIAIALIIWSIIGSILLYNNYFSECANVPKMVEFKQGMTLCLGQSTTFTMKIQPKEKI